MSDVPEEQETQTETADNRVHEDAHEAYVEGEEEDG